MKVVSVDIRTYRHRDGKYVLKELTVFDEFIPGTWRNTLKSKMRLWPEAKLENGRGIRFDTQKEAMQYYVDNREDKTQEGARTTMILQRMKIGEYSGPAKGRN